MHRKKAAEAYLLIGDIHARFKGCQTAKVHYETALNIYSRSLVALKLALLHIRTNEPETAFKFILRWLKNAQQQLHVNIFNILKSGKEMPQNLLSAASEIYFSLGSQWHMGFQKEIMDSVSGTAFDVAHIAWEMQPSEWALEMMTRCLKTFICRASCSRTVLLPYAPVLYPMNKYWKRPEQLFNITLTRPH